MAKIDTLFITETAEKPYPLGPQIPTYIAHIREYPPLRVYITVLNNLLNYFYA